MDAEHSKFEVPVEVPAEGIETLIGLIEQLAALGDTLRLAVPLNPLIGFKVTAKVAVAPVLTVWI